MVRNPYSFQKASSFPQLRAHAATVSRAADPIGGIRTIREGEVQMSAARKAGLQGDRSVVPNVSQDEILNAYLDNPNAAAVARLLKTNERHVRRVVKQFADVLEERRRERLELRQERADARMARSEALADAMLELCPSAAKSALRKLQREHRHPRGEDQAGSCPAKATNEPVVGHRDRLGPRGAAAGSRSRDHWSRPGISRWTRGRSMTTVDLTTTIRTVELLTRLAALRADGGSVRQLQSRLRRLLDARVRHRRPGGRHRP